MVLHGSPASKKARSSSLLRILKKIVLFFYCYCWVFEEGKEEDGFEHCIDIVNNKSNRFYGENFKILCRFVYLMYLHGIAWHSWRKLAVKL